METPVVSRQPAMRALAVAALALGGLLFSLTPIADRIDAPLLDLQWKMLRHFDGRAAPDDIVIVGIDEATLATVPEPPAMWHEPLGLALVRIASAKPRAIGLDLVLPERSYDAIRPGMDRALMVGLAAARQAAPLVAMLPIEARTRSARPVYPPLLAVLEEARLGLGILPRDIDGVTRRYSLALPTEDGAFPTFVGRLCRALTRRCGEGLIHFALGAPYRYIPLHRVLGSTDLQWLERAFRDRIVLIGETVAHADRFAVPVNLAGWERPGPDSPGVLVHAQALRTALLDAAPREASAALALVLVSLAAGLLLMRSWTLALVAAVLAGLGLFVVAVVSLRAGVAIPIAAALVTVATASALRAAAALARRFEIRRR